MIKSAYMTGQSAAISNVRNYAQPEEYIFVAMQNNPMKGKKAQADFIKGVSEWVNTVGCIRNRRMNEKA